MLKPAEVADLLATLHANGYRLRKIGADALEVEDFGPKLVTSEPAPQGASQAEEESPLFDHVGGRPGWLRKPEAKSDKSPWKDDDPSERKNAS